MVTLSQRKISLISIRLGQPLEVIILILCVHILIPSCVSLSLDALRSLSLKRLPSPLCSASGGEGFSDGRIQNNGGFGDGRICYNGSMGASTAVGSRAVAARGFAGGRIQRSGGAGALTAAGSGAAAAWGLRRWWDSEQRQCKGLWWRQDSEQRQWLRGVRRPPLSPSSFLSIAAAGPERCKTARSGPSGSARRGPHSPLSLPSPTTEAAQRSECGGPNRK
jgi:hypothetical protein